MDHESGALQSHRSIAARKAEETGRSSPDDPVDEGTSSAHETFQLREQGHRPTDALTVLTPHEREAIETAFFSELTHAEVASGWEPLGPSRRGSARDWASSGRPWREKL